MYIKVVENRIVESNIFNIRQHLPNISFPAVLNKDTELPSGYFFVHSTEIPIFNSRTHKVIEATPTLEGGVWKQSWSISVLDQNELQQVQDSLSAQSDELRRTAYQAEADPLFFKWQRGEATQAEWLAKVAEIKARY